MIFKKFYLIYLKSAHHNEGDNLTRMNTLKIDLKIESFMCPPQIPICGEHKKEKLKIKHFKEMRNFLSFNFL